MANKINTLEIKRQLLHIAIGTITLFFIVLGLQPIYIFILVVLSSVLSVLSTRIDVPIVSWFLDNFERPKNRKQFPGKGFISFFVGILLSMKLFPAPISYASIMILTLGDSVSNLIGTHLGRVKHPLNGHKSIEGNLFGAFVGMMSAFFFVDPVLAATGSFGAMIIEAIQFRMNDMIVDDNIIVPLSAGAIMLIISAL